MLAGSFPGVGGGWRSSWLSGCWLGPRAEWESLNPAGTGCFNQTSEGEPPPPNLKNNISKPYPDPLSKRKLKKPSEKGEETI